MNSNNLCLGCMMPKGEEAKCRSCGYTEGSPRTLPYLAPGTVLANRFLVGRHTAVSGEGVTYIGFDRKTGRRVDIREYLPQNLCTRRSGDDTVLVRERADAVYDDYLADFIDVSRALFRLENAPGIVPIIKLFECSNTAYAIYEHPDGKPLSELMRRVKRLSWDEAESLFAPLLSSVAEAHAVGLVHFGISPETVYMTHSGRLVLTGFGIPDGRIAETELKSRLCEGFAALEQYSLDARKGKWTDVYALCALILYSLTGRQPPDAPSRTRDARLNVSSDLAESIPAHVISALARGLQVGTDSRTASVDELRSELYPGRRAEARGSGRPAAPAKPAPVNPAPQERSSREQFDEHFGRENSAASFYGNLSSFATKAAGTVKDFGGRLGDRINDYISERRNSRQAEPDRDEGAPDGTPWYMNLSQWQYALLSTSLTIVVLGIIAVAVFLSVRAEISGSTESERTLEIFYVSESDVVAEIRTTATVPELVGKEWNLDLKYQYFDFDILVIKSSNSDDYPKGYIISQNVAPNTEAQTGTPIGIEISLGSTNCKVPDIIGKTVSEAHAALEKAGLLMGTQTEEYSDIYPAGTIIRLTGTSVGATMTRDSLIMTVVSLGPEQ